MTMNAHIKQMAIRAGFIPDDHNEAMLEALARIVVQDCIEQCGGSTVCVGAGLTKRKLRNLYDIPQPTTNK
jgi:hypothetical protein